MTGPFAVLFMPSFDYHLPLCMEGFLIHLSPLWQLPLWQLPLFPSVAQFPCVVGPSAPVLPADTNKAIATVSGLQAEEYVFRLTS